MSPVPPSLTDLALTLVLLLAKAGMFAGTIVLAALAGRRFVNHWRAGLAAGLAIFLLLLPATIMTIIYFDPSAFPNAPPAAIKIGLLVGAFAHVFRIPWVLVLYAVALVEWQRIRFRDHEMGPPPRPARVSHVVGGFAFGVFAAAVTSVLFDLAGVEEGRVVQQLRRYFPGLTDAPAIAVLPMSVGFLTGMAAHEELVYRGGLLAFCFRAEREHPVRTWAGVLVLSFLWSLAHVANTNTPAIKMLQIFLLGLCFTVLARRASLAAAIAAHIGLNLTALALAILLAQLEA